MVAKSAKSSVQLLRTLSLHDFAVTPAVIGAVERVAGPLEQTKVERAELAGVVRNLLHELVSPTSLVVQERWDDPAPALSVRNPMSRVDVGEQPESPRRVQPEPSAALFALGQVAAAQELLVPGNQSGLEFFTVVNLQSSHKMMT